VDSFGSMFFSTGNGSFDATTSTVTPPAPNNDYGESFVNLNPSTLAVQDFYAPSQSAAWTASDFDISAGGISVLPDGVGPTAHPNVLVGADKQGHLWMIDRSFMSGFSPSADNTVQYLTLPSLAVCSGDCVFSSPAYWSGTAYIATTGGHLLALPLSNGLIPANAQVAVPVSESAETYGYPSPTPTISASPKGGAIVWMLDNRANGYGSIALGPAILRAYNATNLGTTLYSSATLPADTAGNAAKFTLPVVANGRVYVAGAGALTVYGLAP
jgi:outer membrane protein assembly factor BamB